jgi:hypothetical protein
MIQFTHFHIPPFPPIHPLVSFSFSRIEHFCSPFHVPRGVMRTSVHVERHSPEDVLRKRKSFGDKENAETESTPVKVGVEVRSPARPEARSPFGKTSVSSRKNILSNVGSPTSAASPKRTASTLTPLRERKTARKEAVSPGAKITVVVTAPAASSSPAAAPVAEKETAKAAAPPTSPCYDITAVKAFAFPDWHRKRPTRKEVAVQRKRGATLSKRTFVYTGNASEGNIYIGNKDL